MKNRILYLDILRIIACIFVILMHSPIPNVGSSAVLSSDSFVTAPCIGLFFMVSGALLLPTTLSTRDFLTRRLSKVIFPTLFWTLFYICIKYFAGSITLNNVLISVLSIPFSAQGNGIMWFMYVLIGLYLITPILSAWLNRATEQELRIVLGLWGITLCYPVLENILLINNGQTSVLYYFGGYAGYFLLGYYLHTYSPRMNKFVIILLFIVPFLSALIIKLNGINIDFYRVFWYLSIFTVMMAVGWFSIIQKQFDAKVLNERLANIITDLSNLSFGIYLVHIFIMRSILWKMNILKISMGGGIFQILITTILTFALSYLVTKLISKLPFSKYIIGV